MFTISTVKTNLFGLIGFRNSEDPAFKSLTSTLTTTSSGMYYEDYHPLITYENLYSIAPNFDSYNIDDWLAATTYAAAELVKREGYVYESLQGSNQNHDPATDTGTWWKIMLSDWLTQKVNTSIAKVVNCIFTDKKLNESTKTLLENIQLFDGAGKITDMITPLSRFVGLEITPRRANNVQISVDYIGLQFSQIQTDLPVYLFHSSQLASVGKYLCTTAGASSFDWIAPVTPAKLTGSFTMNYVDYTNNIDSGGSYYLGYFEDDITGNAIKKRHQFADPPCGGCNNINRELYNLWNKFVTIQTFEIANTNLNGTSLWDISKNGYSNTTNYGLNLSISVKSDLTELIISNKNLFIEAIGYQFAYDMISEMIYNPNSRINQSQSNATKASILYELNSPDNERSLAKRLKDSIIALSFDLSRISQILPDHQRPRIKYYSK